MKEKSGKINQVSKLWTPVSGQSRSSATQRYDRKTRQAVPTGEKPEIKLKMRSSFVEEVGVRGELVNCGLHAAVL